MIPNRYKRKQYSQIIYTNINGRFVFCNHPLYLCEAFSNVLSGCVCVITPLDPDDASVEGNSVLDGC